MVRATSVAPYKTWLYLAFGIVLIGAYDHYVTGPYYLAVGVYALAGLVIGTFKNSPARRLPWLLLAAGTGLWVFGDLVWYLPGTDGPATYPSLADAVYFLGYPLIIVAIAKLLRAGAERSGVVLLDAVMIAIGVGVLVWMRGLFTSFPGESGMSITASVVYLVLDLALVGLGARLLLSGSSRTPASILLTGGLLILVASDIATYVVTWDSPLVSTLFDSAWLASYLAMGAAALHPSMALPAVKPPRREDSFSLTQLLVLAAGGLVAPLTMLPRIFSHDDLIFLGPLCGSILFFFLCLFRMQHLVRSTEGSNRALVEQSRKLEEAEHRYRTLVEQTPAVSFVIEVTDDIKLTYVSPQMTDVLGYEPSEIVNDATWRRLIHPDDFGIALDGYSDEIATHDSTFRMIHKEGHSVWVSARVSRTNDASEQKWQGIILDISERMKVEELETALEREREAVAKLRNLDAMKNGFLQAVSHELRTPLTAIKGLGATLGLRLEDLSTEDVADLVARINVNVGRLEGLLGDLLDVDKLSRGIFLPQLVKTDIGAVVSRTATGLMGPASQRIFVHCVRVDVLADPSKVERIAENLISNAIKHTPPDCTIWIKVDENEGGALITVEDSGDGINEEMRETIFEPFAQWRSEQSYSQGLGLGLSLVRQFAELLNGKAWVEERPGGGAAFKVWLPAGSALPIQSNGHPTDGRVRPVGYPRGSSLPSRRSTRT